MKTAIIVLGAALLLSTGFLTNDAQARGKTQDGFYWIYRGHRGPLAALSYVRDFQKDGIFLEYFEDGDVQQLSWFEKDHPSGTAKFYDQQGLLRKTIQYKEGRAVCIRTFDKFGGMIEEKWL